MNETLASRVSSWWFDFHQRGIFMHCQGVFWPCLVENAATMILRRELTWADWPVRWHSNAVDRAARRRADTDAERREWAAESAQFNANQNARVARARRIRQLGWGQ